MGCGISKKAAEKPVRPETVHPNVADPAPRARSSSTGGVYAAGDDDLGWVSSQGSEAAPVGPPPTGPGPGGETALRVQIELDGSWRDCALDEAKQICDKWRSGQSQFHMTARGQSYSVDLTGPDGPTQTNESTGKRRRLRMLDGGDDLPQDDPGLADGRSSRRDLAATSPELAQQLEYGAQSRRGRASQAPARVLEENPHAQECFASFAHNEAKLCGEWAVFYHSYSFAALLYEVHAAVGSVLFRFRSQYATLPRILVHEFNEIPDAPTLMKKFQAEFAAGKRDHHPKFRKVGLSVMCSLASTGPEACTAMVFVAGYSCKDIAFRGVLETLLESCYVPKGKVKSLADSIIKTSEKHGLDVSQFGGKPCASGKAGHLLQIFVRRSLVDQLVYAAKPYGPIDETRMPISKWMNSNSSFSVGQARIVAHPKYFMQANCVRSFVASADPTFHKSRQAFQEELIKLLGLILGEPSLREKAAAGIYGGTLPSWWSAEDQRKHA